MVIFPVPGILPPFCHAGAARGKGTASHNMDYPAVGVRGHETGFNRAEIWELDGCKKKRKRRLETSVLGLPL